LTKGTVKRWVIDKGFGFIETKKRNTSVFVHHSDLVNAAYLREGEKVQFDIEKTRNGFKAINVEPIFLSAF